MGLYNGELWNGTMVNSVSWETTRRLGFVSSPKLDDDDVDDLEHGSSVGPLLPLYKSMVQP